MLRPIYLQPGDKVALISPSGVATKEQLDAACSLLTSWELEPVPGQHVLSRHGRLAGTDEERLHDLQTALDAEDIRAIWCMAGDYGMLRIVQEADYSIFQGNPKWVIGMNDITVFTPNSIPSESRVYTPSCLPITIQLPRKWSRNYGISFSGSFPRTPSLHTRSTDRESWKPK